MIPNWHYRRDDHPFGPFTLDQMRQLASSGLLAPTDLVRSDASDGWVPAGTVSEWTFPPTPGTAATAVLPVPTRSAPDGAPVAGAGPEPPSASHRSWRAAAVVWLAVVPLALALLSRTQAGTGARLPTALLIAGAGLALLTWFGLGARAVLTGVLPTFSGHLRKRGLAHRIGGLALLFVGASLGIELIGAARNRPTGSAGTQANPVGYERVSYGGEEVLHRPGYRADAERLAGVLRDLGEFNGRSPKTFAIERRDGGRVVRAVMTDAARRNPAVHAFYQHSLGVRVAARAFPGEPVEFQFCDPDLVPGAAVALPAGEVAEIRENNAVYFLGPYRTEADRLAGFFKARLGAPGERAFVLARPGTEWVVAILNADAAALSPDTEKVFAAETNELSRSVFGGAGTQVVVYDRAFQPKRTFRSSAAPVPAARPSGNPFEEYQNWRERNRDKLPMNWDDYRVPYQTPQKATP